MRNDNAIVSAIDIPKRLRAVDQKKVKSIAGSIKEVGLLSPIILYSPDDETLDLVAGAHRLEAVKSLGWDIIPASLIENENALYAQLVEIDENLMRSELSATEYSEHMQRRKEVWEAMREREVSETDVPKPNGRPPEFASETSEATGQTKQHVNRATKRAREVCQEARDIIRGTKADTGAFLDQLSKMDETEQVEAAQSKVDAIERKERDEEFKEQEKHRKREAKERREASKRELMNDLRGKYDSRSWEWFIQTLDECGGSINVSDARNYRDAI